MLQRGIGNAMTDFPARKVLRFPLLLLLLFLVQFDRSLNAQVSVRSSSAQSSPQQVITEVPKTNEVKTLESGVPIEREFADGQTHSYQITLAAGKYIKVEIKELSITVRVWLQQPDGKRIQVHSIFVRKAGLITIERVAESAGIYQLDVVARAKAAPGRYEIRLAQLRLATENERALQQARELSEEFFRLHLGGKFSESRPLLIRSLEIRERVLGSEHLEVAYTLEQLANSYMVAGDYASAEPLLERVLRIKEKTLGPEHPVVAETLNGFGAFYKRRGDHFKAEELFRKSLGIFEKTHQVETITVADTLSNLGDIAYARNDYEKAEDYYQRSLAIREKLFGPDHFHLATLFASIGRVAYDLGDYARADAMFQRSLTLNEKSFGKDHLQITSSLNDLAMLYCTTSDYARAEALYERAQSIYERIGASDANVQNTLFGLSRLYASQGRMSEAIEFQAQANEIEERHVELNLAVGSERERLSFLATLSSRSSRSISLHTSLAPGDPDARELAVTNILRRKGRVQDAMAASLAGLRRRFAPEDQALFDELNNTTSQLARLILSGPQKTSLAEHQSQVKTLEDQRAKLESEISRRSAGFYEKTQPVTLAAVQAAIPSGTALIEFAIYRPFEPKAPDNLTAYGEPRYVAYIVRPQGDVQWKELGEAKAINHAVDALRAAMRDPLRRDVRDLSRSLDEKLMQPIRPLTGDATQLLVSPDGALNLIPFGALIDEQGSYLIRRYSFTYLTSGRDLLRMHLARASKSGPVVVANPSFGEPAMEMASAARRPAAHRGSRSVTAANSLSQVYFAALGGTTQEALTIQTLFPETTLLMGASATEPAINRVVAPRILHIATHGFFLQDGGGSGSANAQLASRGVGTNAEVENPLLRSGLALAGANLRNRQSDDGLLTALEASGLNLWGTKLVVLSACDTGLGEVRNGEGVYGLRRAFVLAGAESLVMSLWPVSDYSTRNLMISYYKNLKLGLGRNSALRQVQLKLLKRNPRLHPFYWANFIQSGDWATLDR